MRTDSHWAADRVTKLIVYLIIKEWVELLDDLPYEVTVGWYLNSPFMAFAPFMKPKFVPPGKQ